MKTNKHLLISKRKTKGISNSTCFYTLWTLSFRLCTTDECPQTSLIPKSWSEDGKDNKSFFFVSLYFVFSIRKMGRSADVTLLGKCVIPYLVVLPQSTSFDLLVNRIFSSLMHDDSGIICLIDFSRLRKFLLVVVNPILFKRVQSMQVRNVLSLQTSDLSNKGFNLLRLGKFC